MPARSLEADALSRLQGSASSPRSSCAVASVYGFTEMHQSPPGRDTELHSLPQEIYCAFSISGGDRRCTHSHKHTHTHTLTRVRARSPREVSPAPSSGAILLLLDFSSWSILPALLQFMEIDF